jgi:hypothetical protein
VPDHHVITLDPLSRYDDPRLYVSLESGERALAEINTSLATGRSPVLLSGPAAVGKTMLLNVLAERERGSRGSVRFARSLSQPPEAVGSWLLRLLFGKLAASPGEAELALLETLRAIADKPVLLVVDEIHKAPLGSVRKLAALARGGAPALALVVCGTDGSDLQEVTATLVPECTVSLPEFLPEREIEMLYDAILAHPGLSPRVLHRLESVARAEILRAASGRPGLLRAELARHEPRRSSREAPRPAAATAAVNSGSQPAQALGAAVVERVAEQQGGRPPRQRFHHATTRLVQPILHARRAARARLESLVRALARVALVRRAVGSAARGAAVSTCVASHSLLRSTTDLLAHSASAIRESATVALRAARRSTERGHARLTRVGAEIGFAARTRAASLATKLGATARGAVLFARRRREHALDRARHTRAELLARAQAHATRVSTEIRTTALEATRRSAVAAARARRAALRAAPAATLPATALLALAVFSLSDFEPDFGTRLRAFAAVGDGTAETAAALPVSVQVNARPWARVRIDGVDLGATPLSHRLAPGVYRLEAEFADGKRIERKIDVRPESRFVSLP